MTPKKPYLIRACYEWIIDNDCTPYIILNTSYPDVDVPEEHVDENEQIVLSIAPHSARDLEIENDAISFFAKFNGVEKEIYASIHSVIAIYAKENGKGIVFADEEEDDDDDTHTPPPSNTKKSSRKTGAPHLTVVK